MNFAHRQISKIVIVGAGPAGASLAIRLAKANFEVVLIDRDKFPRQKLCGEFISPECLEQFRDLGVLDKMLAVGGDRITETVFYEPSGKSIAVQSEWFGGNYRSALSISRAEMDFRLLEQAKMEGAKVLEESNVVDLLADGSRIAGVRIRKATGETAEVEGDLIIDATGRAAVLAKIVQRRSTKNHSITLAKNSKTKYVGFKSHLKNVDLKKGVCEIYFFRGGYGGLSYIENGLANHCFIIKASLVKEFNGNADQIVEKVVRRNKRAALTLLDSEVAINWLAVSVDEFGKKELSLAQGLVSVGDASAFIDPFTGSGMLMALEGADILANLLHEKPFLSEDFVQSYRMLHRQKFQRRLRVCSLLRRAAFTASAPKYLVSALVFSKSVQQLLTRATRASQN